MPSYIPINDYVAKAISQFTAWLLEGRYSVSVYEIMQLNGLPVADVPDAETQYHAHEFLDVTVQPRPIYISPNEVYAMHGLLAQHIDRLVRYFFRSAYLRLSDPTLSQGTDRDDPLRVILQELDGVPQLGNEELKDARDRAITLELTNRFAEVRGKGYRSQVKWEANQPFRSPRRREDALGAI
jgi:Ras GTPase-activating-like protein IQGAP2/3